MDKVIENKLDTSLLESISGENIERLKHEFNGQIPPSKIDDHVDVIKAIEAYGNDILRQDLKEIHRRHFGKVSKVKATSSYMKYLLVTLFCVIAIIGMWFLNRSLNPVMNSGQLFAEFYEPYEYSVGKRSGEQHSQFKLGVFYNDEKFQELVSQYELYYKQSNDLTSDLIHAIGVAYLEIELPYKAIYQFDRILDSNDIGFSESALWYKSLALLKADEYNSCKEIVDKLVKDEESDYHEESKKLLIKLNQLIKQK